MPTLCLLYCGIKAHKRNKAEAEEKRFETEKTGNVIVRIYSRQRRTVTGDLRMVLEVADYRQRVRRMLGFNDNSAAHAEAKRIADALSTSNAAGAEMTNREAATTSPRNQRGADCILRSRFPQLAA